MNPRHRITGKTEEVCLPTGFSRGGDFRAKGRGGGWPSTRQMSQDGTGQNVGIKYPLRNGGEESGTEVLLMFVFLPEHLVDLFQGWLLTS